MMKVDIIVLETMKIKEKDTSLLKHHFELQVYNYIYLHNLYIYTILFVLQVTCKIHISLESLCLTAILNHLRFREQ